MVNEVMLDRKVYLSHVWYLQMVLAINEVMKYVDIIY